MGVEESENVKSVINGLSVVDNSSTLAASKCCSGAAHALTLAFVMLLNQSLEERKVPDV